MTDIKRYACEVYFDRGLYEHSDGLFVSYEDHAAIIAEKDARITELETMFQKKGVQDGNKITALQEQVRNLAAEANYLRNEIKQHSTSVHFCEVCGKDDPCKTDDVCYSLNHPLPATEAAIREIRAQGVEEFAYRMLKLAESSEKAKDILLTERYMAIFNIANDFVSRIRGVEQS